jgi:CheY-like chemotaxis protein
MSTLGNLASEFVECSDGAEAVAAWSQHQPDWTVMDVAMKPIHGLEATGRMPQNSLATTTRRLRVPLNTDGVNHQRKQKR